MRVEQNRETMKNMKNLMKILFKKGLQLARVKFDRDDKEGREALGMGNRSINRSV